MNSSTVPVRVRYRYSPRTVLYDVDDSRDPSSYYIHSTAVYTTICTLGSRSMHTTDIETSGHCLAVLPHPSWSRSAMHHHAGWQQQHDGWQHQSGGYPPPQQYLDVQQQQQQQQPSWDSSSGAGAGWQQPQPQQPYFHHHYQQHQQPPGWQMRHPPTAREHWGVPNHNPGYVPSQQPFVAQELHLVAQRCKEMIRNEISRLAPGGRLPSYLDHPKQFLQQNVFRTHHLVPTYTVREWLHAQPTTFGATVTVPWLVDETCACDHGRRARASQQLAPTFVGASATAAQTLWVEILQRSEDPVAPGSASCFCRVAFGYGLASTRKEVSGDCGLLTGILHRNKTWYLTISAARNCSASFLFVVG
eukprot:COSAG02_NODE_31_length_50774_cov_1928.118204_18_plen_360_part_00